MAFPLLLLFAIGVTDYGKAYLTGIRAANAAKAGAQLGSQSGGRAADSVAIRQAVQDDAGNPALFAPPLGGVRSRTFCRCPGGTTDVSCTTGTCTGYVSPPFFVEVTDSTRVAMVIGMPGLPQTVIVKRTATFRVQ